VAARAAILAADESALTASTPSGADVTKTALAASAAVAAGTVILAAGRQASAMADARARTTAADPDDDEAR